MGFKSRTGQDIFVFSRKAQNGSGAYTASCSMRTGFNSGREDDHSTPSSAGVKKEWSYDSTPLYSFMVWTGTTLYFSRQIYYRGSSPNRFPVPMLRMSGAIPVLPLYAFMTCRGSIINYKLCGSGRGIIGANITETYQKT
jgi:hypothetical protein